MRLTPGSTVGPYEISSAIGAGGMGEVYRARDTRLGREVALKVLPHDVAGDGQSLARFEREARMASALNHPNIVTIHEFARADSDCYLVMELVRGESLRDIVNKGPTPLRTLLDVASGIADGLAAAHAAGIVHRDLKPENVMLNAAGTPKILDFGLVKPTPQKTPADAATELRVTGTGTVVGTTAYMSPEQIRGDEVDTSSDQFAFGVMLYEMASGRHPFRRETPYETATAVLRDDPPPLSDSFPEPLVWIVERCLAKDPAQRYASTTDLARDINALRARSTTARRPSEDSPRSSRRAPVVATIASIAAIAAIIALVATLSSRSDAPPPDPVHLHLTTGELAPHLNEIALPVVISPDGRHLLTQGTGKRGTIELWLTDLRSGQSRFFAENAFGAGWSHDGKALAYFADGKLKTQRIDGAPPVVVCEAPPEGSAAWHGDNILFVRFSAPRGQAGIYRVSAHGGTPELLVPAGQFEGRVGIPWWPQFLPDGKRFLFTALAAPPQLGRIYRHVMLGSLDGTPPKKIGRIDSRSVYAAGHLLFVRDGTLMAQPFDPDTATLSGEARPLVSDLHYFRNTGTAAFSVSNNGILAWRSSRRPRRLVWLDRNGMELQTVETAHFDDRGRLSTDGTRYVVGVIDPKDGVSDVWSYDFSRGSSARLTLDESDQKAPIWAHDRATIYFRTDGNGGPPDIFGLAPGAKSAVVYAGRSVESPEDVSADGKWLLFTTFLLSSSDIHVLPLEPRGEPRPLVTTPFNELSPRFSPDGRWIAYSSNVSGRSEIYAQRFGENGEPIRISQNGGSLPRWSSDGRELFFMAPGGGFLSVPVTDSFGVGKLLFQAADAVTFEPHPSGDRFLVQMQERSGQPEVQLLINWPSALRQNAEER